MKLRNQQQAMQTGMYNRPPLSAGITPTPPWMPEPADSTEPCVYCFSYTYIPMIEFNV